MDADKGGYIMRSIRTIRLCVSLALGLLSGCATYWGILRHLAAPFERDYGPNVFTEDGPVGITMFIYMVEFFPVAVIMSMAVSIAAFIVYGHCWMSKQTTPIQH